MRNVKRLTDSETYKQREGRGWGERVGDGARDNFCSTHLRQRAREKVIRVAGSLSTSRL